MGSVPESGITHDDHPPEGHLWDLEVIDRLHEMFGENSAAW